MKETLIREIVQEMIPALDNQQLEQLKLVLENTFACFMEENQYEIDKQEDYTNLFLSAKRVEGCSERSLKYYKGTIEHMLQYMNIPVKKITTEKIREYLANYQTESKCSKVTIDNVRRILSSFFSWLEDENYIVKSPVRRIHKIRTGTTVKETYSDKNLELMRDSCEEIRDLAMLDLMISTGIRVGELVNLDIADVDFEERECIVFGKGDKERKVYFDAKTKVHLQKYLNSRTDKSQTLFVSLLKPYERIKISGVEIRFREMGKRLELSKVHPHKFRRTMATRAIDKGMPIEQLQKLLGHQQIDTTMQYAMVNQANVKYSHKKYIS
ncbi:site-specific tyrosine recombinase/integron integrase [Anaeromicropila herbilytica]|uniref:site-specific tyrosine recombinase/integron integrase n=1 Tax=Anaeromicropila herbilytica TaxID=2785025 RepID=UPI00232A43BA|nr:site-specific tyrosine recombinase/integron integrase [Anaeromicropila herbilytica]